MQIPPQPYEHRFVLDDEPYLLVGWSRAADRRIRQDYALCVAAAPAILDYLDGADLYAECVARECLQEAPPFFWEPLPPNQATNGQARRSVTFEQVSLDLWERFRAEVETFVVHFRPSTPAIAPFTVPASPPEPDAVATPETVPPRLRGRAE